MIEEYRKPEEDQALYLDIWDFFIGVNKERPVTAFIEGGEVFEFWKNTLPQKIKEKGQALLNQ